MRVKTSDFISLTGPCLTEPHGSVDYATIQLNPGYVIANANDSKNVLGNLKMNKERIKYAISIMEQAENLDMGTWQEFEWDTAATTMEDLHTCGNTACFAGYIALSPLFKAEGGEVESDGEPLMGEKYGDEAIIKFFEMDEKYNPLIYAIVYGHLGSLYIGEDLEHIGDELDRIGVKGVNDGIIHQINEICDLTPWRGWEPKHVIKILESLLNGDFDWLLEEGNE